MRYDPPPFADLSAPRRALWGARYLARGAHLVATRPGLWWTIAVPAAITVGLFVLGFALLGVLLPWLTTFLWAPGPHHPVWLWWVYRLVAWTFRLAVAVALAVALYLTAGLIATPFTDLLSQRVEREVLGAAEEPAPLAQALADLWWSVVHSLASLALYLLVMGVAVLLNLLPGLGSVASFVLGAAASGLFFSREAMDGCLSRRRLGYVRKWRLVLSQGWLALGFGLAVAVLMGVPFLNFLVLPMAVAGGTLLFCHLERAGLLPADRSAP